MRITTRVTFQKPLAAPGSERVNRVRAELQSLGFWCVGMSATRLGFRRRKDIRAILIDDELKKLREIIGGNVEIDPGGRHADVMLHFSPLMLAGLAVAGLASILLPIPWWLRGIPLFAMVWRVVSLRRAVPLMTASIRRAAEAP